MKRSVSASAGLACLLAGLVAAAEPITDPAAPLVKQLEMRFASSLAAARSGNLDAYWGHRTAASRTRPPELDSTRLKLLAELLPPLDTMQFVRLDCTARMARALYRWFLPLLRLDTVPEFVQLIKLVQAAVGQGSETVRPPRLPVAGALEDGFASRQPTLVAVPIDYRENLLLTERLGTIDDTL